MPHVAKGLFNVQLAPISAESEAMARMSINKQYAGALVAVGTGQMLTSGVEEHGSRVYVALEAVAGKLDGREGAFILAHRGTMTPGAQNLSIIVVPDSGTGELVGLSGEMSIEIKDGVHHYELSYEL